MASLEYWLDRVEEILYVIVLLSTFILVTILIGMNLKDYGFDPSLFVPAFTVIIGSFGVYFLRQRRRRKRVESALAAELKQMDNLENLPKDLSDIDPTPPNGNIPESKIPTPESLPTDVYDSNLSEMSLLHQPLYQEIVAFYTLLNRHKHTLHKLHEKRGNDVKMDDQESLYNDARKMKEKRKMLLRRLGEGE